MISETQKCCRCGSAQTIPTTSICRSCMAAHASDTLTVAWACLLPDERDAWLRRVCVRRSA